MLLAFNITPATKEDVPQLVKLVNSAYRGESSKQGWTTEADLLDGIRVDENSLTDLVEEPDTTLLKYTNAHGNLTGCVYLHKQGTDMYLGMLTVSPREQANGIGKKLLRAAENFALEQGCTAIEMTVISVRHELINWYERQGYQPTGETKPFPDDPRFGIPKQPLSFIVMKKTL
jgi:ribosomal protein S18 acetylase RimI-like enzyme